MSNIYNKLKISLKTTNIISTDYTLDKMQTCVNLYSIKSERRCAANRLHKLLTFTTYGEKWFST